MNSLQPPILSPRTGYCEALVAPVEEPEYVPPEHVAHVLHTRYARPVRLHRPVGHVERSVYYRNFVFFCCVLGKETIELVTSRVSKETIRNVAALIMLSHSH